MRRFAAPILVLTLLTASCASASKSLQVTGESIVALGNQFSTVSRAMTDGCNRKVYTVKTCSDYRVFGEKFKQAYPAAKTLWIAATQYEDQTLAANASSALSQLAADLAPFLTMTGGK
jgi:hypothetical protein